MQQSSKKIAKEQEAFVYKEMIWGSGESRKYAKTVPVLVIFS